MFSRAKKPKATTTTTTPFFSFLLPSKNNLFSSAANTRASDGAEVLEKNERNPERRRSVVVCARLLVSLFLHVLFFFENVALHHQSYRRRHRRHDSSSFFLPTAINNKYGQTIRAITEECDDGFAAPGICSTASKREYRRKIRTDAFFSGSSNNNVAVAAASSFSLDKMEELLGAIWKFVRPHTIRGTLLGTTALVSKVLIENPELIQLVVPRAIAWIICAIMWEWVHRRH